MANYLSLDRSNGVLTGATIGERLARFLFAAGAKATAPIHWRGFSLGCKAIRTVIPSREIVVSLNDDALFAFPFGDGYWSLLFDRKYRYEGEIELFLRAISHLNYDFIDGGANFGYWSVLVSSRPFGRQRVIAIEPSPSNAERLTRNSELNGCRFAVVQKAITAQDRQLVSMDGAKHEAFRVIQSTETLSKQSHQVGTVRLDSLSDRRAIGTSQLTVVKLDLEGMEIEALEGSRQLLGNETIIIVEDHGSDRTHAVSDHLLNRLGCQLFIFDKASGRFERISALSSLNDIKKSRVFGYNIFATRSPFWDRTIEAIGLSH
jgi:FkbM family methyltransferase